MIKPWHLVPVLAAVALGASAYWWQARKDTWSPPAARKPDLPQMEPMPQPLDTRALHATKRPVFWASRRPADTGGPKGGLAGELAQSRLTAVLESGASSVAILQRQDGSPLKITTESTPWRIESFDGRKAVFVSADAQRIERPLEAGNPAQTKAPQGATHPRPPSADQ
ncbi:MAG: hypothetical protein WBA58_14100 [Giesbergeria sp.]